MHGGADIVLYKTGHVMLSSVQVGTAESERGLRAGEYGYQEHLMYAVLGNDCFVFATHPGDSEEGTGYRPGYWYGNGVVPAVRQVKNLCGMIFSNGGAFPMHFVHVYCPSRLFAEERQVNGWRAVRRGDGYLGIWCSGALQPHPANAYELRCRADPAAFVFCVSDADECGTFDGFVRMLARTQPVFSAQERRLVCGGLELLGV